MSDFKSLSTANLPDPAIDPAAGEEANDHFNTVIWTGDGSSGRSITTGHQPDWVWTKERNSAINHIAQDSVLGTGKYLHPNTTAAEQSASTLITSFDSNGFTVGNSGSINGSSDTYVAWSWKAGTSFSNDASATGVGTIDSTGTVNTKAGFSIISYTGTGSNGTVAHGLGAVPEWIIFRDRDNVNDWVIYHVALGNTHAIKLNSTAVAFDEATIFNDTTPTSSVFSLGTANLANNTAATIAYCFAPKEGYSAFGSYEGNGDANGPFIYTGFRPAWLMIKNADFAEIWPMFDNKRDPSNLVENPLYANLSSSESAASSRGVDFLSNGFKIRGTDTSVNRNGDTHIYMAFAEQPFKFSNAR